MINNRHKEIIEIIDDATMIHTNEGEINSFIMNECYGNGYNRYNNYQDFFGGLGDPVSIDYCIYEITGGNFIEKNPIPKDLSHYYRIRINDYQLELEYIQLESVTTDACILFANVQDIETNRKKDILSKIREKISQKLNIQNSSIQKEWMNGRGYVCLDFTIGDQQV